MKNKAVAVNSRVKTLSRTSSELLEIFKPFRELVWMNTPLTADFERGQFFSVDHALQGSSRQMQQLSSFLQCQKFQRLGVILHSSLISSNRNATPVLRATALLLEKTGSKT